MPFCFQTNSKKKKGENGLLIAKKKEVSAYLHKLDEMALMS